MTYRQKIKRILGITGWTNGHLAGLLGTSPVSMMRWTRGRFKPNDVYTQKIDVIYEGVVKPLECEIDRLSDEVEKKILRGKIESLKDDDCAV